MKKVKNSKTYKNKNINKVKFNKNIILSCISLMVLLIVSLFFASYFELLFNLKPNFSKIEASALEVHFVNVGQGDAILINLPDNQTVLVDSGPKSAEKNLLHYIDNIFFSNSKSKTFDHVVLTHSDSDHSGNMLAILNNYKVNNFYRPAIYSETIESSYIESNPHVTKVNTQTYSNIISKLISLEQKDSVFITTSTSGITIGNQENNYITFLSPNVPVYTGSNAVNNYSPVMLVEFNNQKIMLTGDITSQVELEVVNNHATQNGYLDVDVLKLAHHGSNTSTSALLLENTKPEFAVISVGNNSYGHPSAEVINRIYDYSISNNVNLHNNILQTKEKGNIVFYVNPSSQVNYLAIANAHDYLFVSWWQVVVVGNGMLLVIILVKGVRLKTSKASNV